MCIIAAFFGNLPFFGAFALLTFEEIHMSLPHCPKCNSEYTYEDNGM
ncbi:phnA Zinc-Ribbon family protein [Escherichia coli 2756500]|nr:phnA Zinc-Ribbon family protein [Escherichia coli 2756500]